MEEEARGAEQAKDAVTVKGSEEIPAIAKTS